jgi:hypothetical protein
VCGSANGYVESLDPLEGKEEAEREAALRGQMGEVRAHAHRTTLSRRPQSCPGMRDGLTKPELEQEFIVEHDRTGLLEAVALVKRDRAAVALAGARAHHLDPGSAAKVLDDQVERCGAEALPLVALVDQQLPEVVRYVLGAGIDLVADTNPTGVSSA